MSHTYNDVPAAGSKLSVSISSTQTDIPGINEINWDGYKRAVRNPTYMQSPTVPKKPGMSDLGQIKCKVWYDPDNTVHKYIEGQLALTAAAQNVALDTFVLTYPDGFTTPTLVTIVGFVSEFSRESGEAEAGQWAASLTVEVNSATVTPGTP